MEFDYNKFIEYLIIYFSLPLMAILLGQFIWTNYHSRNKNSRIPLSLLGRNTEIQRLVMKIKSGQSSAIIGIFGQERTDMLTYLRDKNLYGHNADNFIFSFMDISTLEINCKPEQFWETVLEPLREKIFQTNSNQKLKKTYSDCQIKHFSNESLDKLFEEINKVNLRLVLLLDRFHDIVHKPNLNEPRFLANLRSLSSYRYPSPLCLVITAHESLRKLHEEIIKKIDYSTSPFFNFMDVDEITLGALSESGKNKVLKKLKLSKEAQQFIKNEVGRHPYLLKIATNRLTEAYQAQETNPVEITKQHFKQHCKTLLDDMQHTLSPKMNNVFGLIAQDTSINLDDYTEVLKELEKQGLIKKSEDGKWQMFSPLFVELLKEQNK